MNYNNPEPESASKILKWSCGILFALFCFLFLFRIEGDLLSYAQNVLSGGITHYHILVGAIIITIVLSIIQQVTSRLSRLPAYCYTLSYIPVTAALAAISSMMPTDGGNISFGIWSWLYPSIVAAYIIVTIIINVSPRLDLRGDSELWLYLWPNYLMMLIQILIVGSCTRVSDKFIHEARTERLIIEHQYEDASQVAPEAYDLTPRFCQLRNYALAQQGQLGECIFQYPQPFGTKGLIDVADTCVKANGYRFSNWNICARLGAKCGKTIRSTARYMHIMNANDTIQSCLFPEYMLCYNLLQKDLNSFESNLKRYYHYTTEEDTLEASADKSGTKNMADKRDDKASDSQPSDSIIKTTPIVKLPRSYREAIILIADLDHDETTLQADTTTLHRYRDFQQLCNQYSHPNERSNYARRNYGDTYWWYYYYQK